jgi:hypothetical protein
MAIAVTWIQGVLRVGTGSSGSPRVFVDPQAGWSREEFPQALVDALIKAKAPAGEVYLGTDSPLIIPLVEEIPPVPPASATKLLQKRAEKAAVFAEPIFMGATAILGNVGAGLSRYLLQVAPAAWVKAVDVALATRGYQLAGLFPAALALQPLLQGVGAPKDEVVLVAAEAENGLLQVVGRSDGAILFYRTLPGAETRGAAEVLRELRRLALYAEQRLGFKVKRVFFSGTMASSLLEAVQGAEDLTIAAGPGVSPLIYLRQLFQAKARQPDNVVPRQIAMRTQIRRWKFLAGMSALGVLAFSILWAGGRFVERGMKAAEIRKIWEQQAALVAKADREKEGLVRFGRKLELVRILRDETARPVPEIFLRTLPELLPPSLQLTQLRVELNPQRSAGAGATPVYRIELSGRTVREDQPVLEPVGQLVTALEKSDWKAKILGGTGRENAAAPVPTDLRAPGRFFLAAEVQ